MPVPAIKHYNNKYKRSKLFKDSIWKKNHSKYPDYECRTARYMYLLLICFRKMISQNSWKKITCVHFIMNMWGKWVDLFTHLEKQ